MKAYALPVMQDGKAIQCFDCKEWGHKRVNCPKKKANPARPPLPPQRQVFQNRNQKNIQGKPNQTRQPPTNYPPKVATINFMSVIQG